ncbi:MAG: ATP-dependent helicase, partial [Microcystaceae cyanobacterium]
MKILHGTWIPDSNHNFVRAGNFALWVETDDSAPPSNLGDRHPFHLAATELSTFLRNDLGIKESRDFSLKQYISPKYFTLPSTEQEPLPSPELSRYLEAEPSEVASWQQWEIDCYLVPLSLSASEAKYIPLTPLIKFIKDLHFLSRYNVGDFQLGSDLLFWHYYLQSFTA